MKYYMNFQIFLNGIINSIDKNINVAVKKTPFVILSSLGSCLFLSGCGDGSGGGSSAPVAVNQSALPSIVQEGKQTQSSISLSSTVPQLSSIGSADVRQVSIRDISNCSVKLSFSPSNIKVPVGEQEAAFSIFAPTGSGKCRHTIKFNGDGVSDSKIIDVITDKVVVNVTANAQESLIGDIIAITLTEPEDWETVASQQSYNISTTAPGVTIIGNPCALNPLDGENSCQVTATIGHLANKGEYTFMIEPVDDTGVPTDPEELSFSVNVIGAYVTNFGSNSVQHCSITNDGSLTNCITAGNQFSKPESVTLDNNGGAYISNYDSDTVSYCTIADNGTFDSCIVAGDSIHNGGWFDGPSGIAMDGNGGVYVSNYNSADNTNTAASDTVSYCTIAGNGTFSNCITANPNNGDGLLDNTFDMPSDIILDGNGGAYISNFNSNQIDYCTIATDGRFESCIVAGNENTSGLNIDRPEGLKLDSSGGIYIASANSAEISYCKITDNLLTGCIRAGFKNDFGFDGPTSIDLDNNDGAYITNVETHEISYCDILPNGEFLSCKTARNQENHALNEPFGITLSF